MAVWLRVKVRGRGLSYGLWAVHPLCLRQKAMLQLRLVALCKCYMFLPVLHFIHKYV